MANITLAEPEISIKLDVKEDEKAYTVRADIPGVKKGEKTIYSERSYGMVSRSFSLPTDLDAEGAKAEYKDGVLSLTLPKKANGTTRRVAVS